MPYTRPIRRFYLTPPKLWTFILSLILALVAVLAVYGHFAPLHPINGFLTLLIAWLILAAGVLIRGISLGAVSRLTRLVRTPRAYSATCQICRGRSPTILENRWM